MENACRIDVWVRVVFASWILVAFVAQFAWVNRGGQGESKKGISSANVRQPSSHNVDSDFRGMRLDSRREAMDELELIAAGGRSNASSDVDSIRELLRVLPDLD